MPLTPFLNAAALLPSYASDTSGVCSALYECGGMIVIHDASGCNSTYSTFDEPRWWDMESLIFISGLTEMEAISGNEQRFIDDCVRCAKELSPAFLALCTSPMPVLIGTDMQAIAYEIEQKLALPVFSVRTNGIYSYLVGASRAWQALLEHFPVQPAQFDKSRVNILGACPLDCTDQALAKIKTWLAQKGFTLGVSLARGFSLGDLARLPEASVNLVISSSALAIARDLNTRFGQPYVVGLPFGDFAEELALRLTRASEQRENFLLCHQDCEHPKTLVIGESVFAVSLALSLEAQGQACRIYCPLETPEGLLGPNDFGGEEDEVLAQKLAQEASRIYADPFYTVLSPPTAQFFPCPHTAFSGRVYLGSRNIVDLLLGDSPC